MKNLPIPTQVARLSPSIPANNSSGSPHHFGQHIADSADFSTYLRTLRRRKWMIIIPLLVVIPLVAIGLFLQKHTYEATATLLIEPVNLRVVEIEEVTAPDRSNEYYKSQYALLKSQALIAHTLDRVGTTSQPTAQEEPAFLQKIRTLKASVRTRLQALKAKVVGHDPADAVSEEELARRAQIATLKNRLRIEPTGMRLVNVTIAGPDPVEITKQVNTLVDIYVQQNLETKLDASQQASTWLVEKVAELKDELEANESELQAFVTEHNLLPSHGGDKSLVEVEEFEEFQKLSSAYATLKAQRVELEAHLFELQQLTAQPFATPLPESMTDTNAANPLIDAWRSKYAELGIERAELLENLKPRHPKVVAIDSKMGQVRQKIAAEFDKYGLQIQAKLRIVERQLSIFERKMNETKGSIIQSNEVLERYAGLKRDIAAKRTLYENLLARMNETELTKSLQTNNARVLQRALIPVLPVPKRLVLKLLISILVVFSLGVGVAFATELIDNRFKNLDDVEAYLQIPFLGLILAHSSRERRNLVMMTQPRSAVADGYRIVRTNIQMISTQRPLASLMITSAVAGEGKTTTTANLGVAFAQLGRRVLLIDADLRRPALHTMFNMNQEDGLSDLLTDQTNQGIDSFIKDTGVEDLKIITSGKTPHNPAELLSGNRIRHICQSLIEEFDLVIFDSAITLSIPDTLIMSPHVDGVCLVHNPDRSDKSSVDTSKRMLERSHAHIIGVLFNNIKLRTSTYGDYHYYSSTYTLDAAKKVN